MFLCSMRVMKLQSDR